MLDSFYSTVDVKKLTTLISLDISAAFDTISHGTLLKWLYLIDWLIDLRPCQHENGYI